MLWVTLTGVKPYDGRYELVSDENMTTREWGWVKRFTGYLPLTIEEGLRGVDAELYAGLAAIALVRAGKADRSEIQAVFDRLLDAPPFSTFQIENDDDQAADQADGGAGGAGGADPPSQTSSAVKKSSSGDGSNGSWETWAETLGGSGTPASDTSESPSTRSAT